MSRYIKYQTADGGIVLVEVEGEAEAIHAEAGVVKAGRVGDAVRDFLTCFDHAHTTGCRRRRQNHVRGRDGFRPPECPGSHRQGQGAFRPT